MNNINAKAFSEVMEIINYLPYEDYIKIPQEEIEYYNNNKDSSYDFCLDLSKKISDQNLLKETYEIILYLYNEYFLSEEQKSTFTNLLNTKDNLDNEKKIKKYNPDELFKKSNSKTNNYASSAISTNLPVSYTSENWFKKLIKFIKRKFNHI